MKKLIISFSGGRTSAYMTKMLLDNLDRKVYKITVMRNKELIALLQEQDPEAEVMIRTSDGEYEYDPVDVTWDEQIECVIIQEG